ncbi:MAG: universal stress protein [Cyclobacteriaceae bacterium]|nr:universal stress protein [Cyclobacteriaceae bacterium]
MKKILVPCDFSDQAVQAFRFACEIARESKGEVRLLNIVELPVLHDSVLMPTLYFEEAYLKDSRENAEKSFEKMISKWAKDDQKVKGHVEFGAVTPTIARFIKEHKIDLVIMGTAGASGLKEFLVGSNTEKIVRSSAVPVIAVKKSAKSASIRHIVFPSVLTIEEDDICTKVRALQNFFGATLHIVFINTPSGFRRDAEVKQELTDFAKRNQFKNYTINAYNDYDEESGIRNFAHEVGADLIAMATHGRRGISHLMNGSLAEDIVNHVDCPIWTCVDK